MTSRQRKSQKGATKSIVNPGYGSLAEFSSAIGALCGPASRAHLSFGLSRVAREFRWR